MNSLVPLPVLLPILGAGASLALLHHPRIQRWLSLAVLPVERSTGGPADAAVPAPRFALDRPLSETLDAYERELIRAALQTAAGNVAEAARRLQTDRPNLYRRMRRLGIGGDGEE